MKLETLKKDNKKKIVIGVIAVISITLVGVLASSFAKYQNTQSIPLANGIVNYELGDINMMAIKIKNDSGEYVETPSIPTEGYKLNSEKTYCKVNGEVDKSVTVELDGSKIWLDNIKKNTKCYLFFDKQLLGSDAIIDIIKPKDPTSNMFANVASTDEGVFKAEDNDGTSYYYRGAVTNNYLKFANKWWRIIRINGDGTIRIIYDGTTYHANGTNTSDSIAVTSTAFNSTYNNAVYVGFKYGTTSEARGTTNKSTILTALETWYTNNLASYANRIDTNAGFCGDRTSYTNTSGTTAGTGYGTASQYFADYVRLVTNKTPVLTCANTNDLYTISGASKGNKSLQYPIGLINANEVSMAGGVWSTNNTSYYLYNNQLYWTLSPTGFWGDDTEVFAVYPSGAIGIKGTWNYNGIGARPVINLRADVTITGSGTGTDPYVVVGAE